MISITGSREGITTPPSDIVYNVTKAAVRVLAESLEHELRTTSGGEPPRHPVCPCGLCWGEC